MHKSETSFSSDVINNTHFPDINRALVFIFNLVGRRADPLRALARHCGPADAEIYCALGEEKNSVTDTGRVFPSVAGKMGR